MFDQVYKPPATDGSGNNRDNLRAAVALFKQAGYEIKGGKLVNTATGQPLAFEIMIDQGGLFERIVGPFAKNLERLGVGGDGPRGRRRAVPERGWTSSTSTWSIGSFGQSLSPGNEQRDFWGSQAADMPGSRNLIGVKDPIVDALVDKIITADSREALIAACRALDRVLLWGHYVIPQWHNRRHPHRLLGQAAAPGDLAALRRRPVRLVVRSRCRGQGRPGAPEPGRGGELSRTVPCWPISSAACC